MPSNMEMFEAEQQIAMLEAENERLREALNEQRNVAEATIFQYDTLMRHAERLRAASRDVLDMLPYHGLLDLPELRAALDEEVGE